MSITNTTSSIINIIRGLINDKIRTDGRAVHEYTDDNKFSLKHDYPSSSSIIVLKNSVELDTQDWSYDSDTNRVNVVFISSGLSLSSGDIIDIRYNYYMKYSDTELSAYLESALTYFALHRYKKIFEINSDNEIVSINDIDPNTNELYFISIIASILIDPQNIKIKIPDLEIEAKRDKSDQQQILEAFRSFKRFLGEITLEEIETEDF